MPVLAAERLVKCPTEHCPGWITLDDARPQTVPCRYCRITVHTLSYLLGQIGQHEATTGTVDLWAPKLHERFNDLMLKLGGAVHNNVYIRPMERVVAARAAGKRGEALEYNPAIAAAVGPAPLVALLLHDLLHFELHLGEERPLQMGLKQNARDKDFLGLPLRYAANLSDHIWLAQRMDEAAPGLRQSLQEWGLDVALMLSGNESFFLTYIDERNRRWLVETLQSPDITPDTMREQTINRLADLTLRFFGAARDPLLPRLLAAVQLADLQLHNPAAAKAYAAALGAVGFPSQPEALATAKRIAEELAEVRDSAPKGPDTNDFRRALESAIRAMGVQNFVEVYGQKK